MSSNPQVNIFTPAYFSSLLSSPIRTVQTGEGSVRFEEDIPHSRVPHDALGLALMNLYYLAILDHPRSLPDYHPGLIDALQKIKEATDVLPREQYEILGGFNYEDYRAVIHFRNLAASRSYIKDELSDDKNMTGFWGSNRQLMFGKVMADIYTVNLAAQIELEVAAATAAAASAAAAVVVRPVHAIGVADKDLEVGGSPVVDSAPSFVPYRPRLHLLSAVLCSPTGGIIGPGTHNFWVEHLGKIAYTLPTLCFHSICHDASGYSYNALRMGVGYTYTTGFNLLWKLSGRWWIGQTKQSDSLAGQISGCRRWQAILKKEEPNHCK